MKSKNTLIVAAALLLTAPAFGATPVNDDKNATQTVTVNQETIGRIVSEIRLDGNNAVLTFIDGSTMTADMRLVTLTMSYSETTGVSSLHMTDKDGNVSIYDLQGRKVANSQKSKTNGIYIVNGKKVVNKK
jgi:hypothetical protein